MTLSIPRSVRWTAAVLLAMPFVLRADNSPPASEKLVYEKPAGVTEKTRIPGRKVRGSKSPLPPDLFLVILAPDHTGFTVQENPSLFWYLNVPVKGVKYKLSVTKDGEPEPLLEKQLDPEKDTGIQRLNLKDVPKALETNAEYQVTIAITPNPKDQSGDVVTSGIIKRIAPSEKLLSKLLTRPTPAERAIVYARQGIWWDALTAISDQIAANPDNKELHTRRAFLLSQVGLPEAAEFDTKLAGH